MVEQTGGITELFSKGGPVMYILVLLSIYALAVVLYKAYQFYKLKVFNTSFVTPVLDTARTKGPLAALPQVRLIPGPVARVMETALSVLTNRNIAKDDRQEEIARVGNNELQHLETHLRGLEMVAHAGPLVGLLGTVTGIIHTFSQLEVVGTRVDPLVLAGGIWEALIATASGLIVAIPAMVAHYCISGVIERTRLAMQDAAVRVLGLEEFIRAEELALAERQRQLQEEQRELEERRRAAKENRLLEAQIVELEERRKELLAVESKLQEEQQMLAEKRQMIEGGVGTLKLLSPRYG